MQKQLVQENKLGSNIESSFDRILDLPDMKIPMRHIKTFELYTKKTFSDWLKDPKPVPQTEFELEFPVRKNWRFNMKKFSLLDVDQFIKSESGMSILDSISSDMDLDLQSILANENEIYDTWLDQEWGGKRNYIRFLDTFGLNFTESKISNEDFESIKNSFNSSNIEKEFDSRAFGGTFNISSIKIEKINNDNIISILVKANKSLNSDQKDTIKDFITGQLADEWGNKYSRIIKKEKRGKLEFATSIEFYWGSGYPDWKITIS